jgi:protoporphyrinogen/coproporphyrinogen III oxidase
VKRCRYRAGVTSGRAGDADVLVVGAGLAGLAAARRLAREGFETLVVEREAEPGGRARTEQWEGCTIELGALFVTPAYRRVRRLIRECGLDDRLVPMPNAFRIRIRRDGRWHEVDIRRPTIALGRYRGIGWREKAALARLLPSQLRVAASMRYFDLASAAPIDSRALEDVIGPGATRYFAAAVAEVFCGYRADEISLAFGVLGSRYPLRRAWILEGGIGALTGELGRRLGVRCGVEVERVRLEGREVVAETRDGAALRSRAVILATRAFEAVELWPEAPEDARRFLSQQAYSQGFGVLLRTRAPVMRRGPSGREAYMDVVPQGERTGALLSVLYMDYLARDGGLLGLAASPEALADGADGGELAAQLETELAEVHPTLQPEITARRAMSWRVFVPAYPAGRARELAAFRAGFGPGPVQLAGDYLRGPMMESAVRTGEDAAARVAAYLQSG